MNIDNLSKQQYFLIVWRLIIKYLRLTASIFKYDIDRLHPKSDNRVFFTCVTDLSIIIY